MHTFDITIRDTDGRDRVRKIKADSFSIEPHFVAFYVGDERVAVVSDHHVVTVSRAEEPEVKLSVGEVVLPVEVVAQYVQKYGTAARWPDDCCEADPDCIAGRGHAGDHRHPSYMP